MKKFTFILIFFSFLGLKAQENKRIIYKQGDGKLLTENQYLKMKNDFKEKMKNKGKIGEVKEIINDSVTEQTVYKNFKVYFVVEAKKEMLDTLINKKFPTYELLTLESEKISLSEFVGKRTLITFWFTSCAPCIQEFPALRDLKKKYGNKVNFVAITFNKAKEVKLFLEKKEFDFLHIVDANDFIKDIGLNTYPRNVFLDKNGIIKAIKYGIPQKKNSKNKKEELEFDLTEFEKQLNELL